MGLIKKLREFTKFKVRNPNNGENDEIRYDDFLGNLQEVFYTKTEVDDTIEGIETDVDGKVPYTGAEQDVNLGDHSIKVTKLLLDTTKTYTDEERALMPIGTLFWDIDWKCYTLKETADTYHQIGSELPLLMKNVDNTGHLNGQPVYVFGGNTKKCNVKLADNTTHNTSKTIALATQDVANTGNALGKYAVFGNVNEVPYTNIICSTDNYADWAEGKELYLCSERGKLSITKELGKHSDTVGIITDKSGSNVTIFVKPIIGVDLEDIHNIVLTDLTENQVLKYDGTKWVNGDASGGSNLANTYYVDSVYGDDATATGLSDKPFKTVGAFLTYFDLNTGVKHTLSPTGNIANGSNVINSVSDTSGLDVGMIVIHTNIPYNTKIVSKTADTITLDKNATGTTNGATLDIIKHIFVNVAGSVTTTAKCNRRNITYNGNAEWIHNSNTEYIVEIDTNDLKQPVEFFNSKFQFISINTKGFIKSNILSANDRTAVTGFIDFIFKFKSYVSKQDITHCDFNNGYSSSYTFYYHKVKFDFDFIDVVGSWHKSYQEYGSHFIYNHNYIKTTKNVISSSQYGANYDIVGDLLGVDGYPALFVAPYQDNGVINFKGKFSGDMQIAGGGKLDVITDSSNALIKGGYYRQFEVSGRLYITTITGNIIFNATSNILNVSSLYGGVPLIVGMIQDLRINEASSIYPVFINATSWINLSKLTLSADREVVLNGNLINSGSSYQSISAGHLRVIGTIKDAYYGLLISGTGKVTIEASGLLEYARKGAVVSDSGHLVINGIMRRTAWVANTEICAVEKSGGMVTIGSSGKIIVGNGMSPIKCTANTSASKDVKYHNGASTNCDGTTYGLLFAYDGSSFAPNDLLTGAIQENTLITD